MKTPTPSKVPLWRKSMLSKLNITDIKDSLYEMQENGDPYGYEYGDESGYYAEYKDQFDELSAQAGMLLEAIEGVESEWYVDEYDFADQWNDLTVGMLGELYTVWGFDSGEMDYYNILEPDEEKWAEDEAIARLSKLTKKEMITRMRFVLKTLVLYYDIKAAHDCLVSIVEELDEKGAILERKNEAMNRIYEDITGKDSDNFDALIETIPQRMWVE